MLELDNYVNIHEAAKRLGIHEESLRRIIRIGTLPAEKIGGQWFISKEQLAIFSNVYDHKTGKRRHII